MDLNTEPVNKGVDSSTEKQTTQHDMAKLHDRRTAQLRSTNISLDPNSTSHRASVVHPGLAPEAIDRFGNPSTIALVLVARLSRQVAMTTPCQDGRCFLEIDRLRAGRMTFMAAVQYHFNRCAYSPEEKKYPLNAVLEIGHVGRTSFSIITDVTLPSGDVMLTAVNQMVLIDPSTRRPTPLPDYWRVHYGPLCVRQQPLLIPTQSKPRPPDSSDVPSGERPNDHHRLTVAWSDTDNNDHTHFTSYIRFALDALHSGMRKRCIGEGLTEADVRSGVSEVKVMYQGESDEGDVLHVTLWRPLPDSPRTVVCGMEKEGGKPVCQVTLTFHQCQGH